MQSKSKDVVIIGAGISGLVCAYRLKRLGVEVLLVEQSARPGGVMQSSQIDEFLIERGPNSAQGVPELLALVDELGITGELLEGNPKAPAYVYFNGRLRAVPMSPPSLLRSDLLSLGGKLRLLREPLIVRREPAGEESVADFITRRLGAEIAERLVAPFVSGIYAGDEKRLSIQAAFPQLANLESSHGSLFRGALAKLRETRQARKNRPPSNLPKRKRSVSFRNGMQVLPETLAAKLGADLLTECSGVSIADCGLPIADSTSSQLPTDKFVVSFNHSGIAQQITCKQLVIATPAMGAAKLIAALSKDVERLLQEIEYPPLAIVHMTYGKAGIANNLDGFGFLAAPCEKLNVLGCIFSSSQFAGRAPQDKALLTIFLGGARNPELTELSDDRLSAAAHAELKKILGIQSLPRIINISRWARAIPQYNLGHAARVRRIEALASKIKGFHLIGNYLHGVSVGDCVKDAQRVAVEMARRKT
jgi:protoporphyrinogen/coproporphyrinogen III oxidase